MTGIVEALVPLPPLPPLPDPLAPDGAATGTAGVGRDRADPGDRAVDVSAVRHLDLDVLAEHRLTLRGRGEVDGHHQLRRGRLQDAVPPPPLPPCRRNGRLIRVPLEARVSPTSRRRSRRRAEVLPPAPRGRHQNRGVRTGRCPSIASRPATGPASALSSAINAASVSLLTLPRSRRRVVVVVVGRRRRPSR